MVFQDLEVRVLFRVAIWKLRVALSPCHTVRVYLMQHSFCYEASKICATYLRTAGLRLKVLAAGVDGTAVAGWRAAEEKVAGPHLLLLEDFMFSCGSAELCPPVSPGKSPPKPLFPISAHKIYSLDWDAAHLCINKALNFRHQNQKRLEMPHLL